MKDNETPQLLKYTCARCGASWTPRKLNPRQCPACKTSYWNKPKSKKTKTKEVKDGNR